MLNYGDNYKCNQINNKYIITNKDLEDFLNAPVMSEQNSAIDSNSMNPSQSHNMAHLDSISHHTPFLSHSRSPDY